MGKIMRNGIEYGGGLPTGGTPGQVLTKTATGAEWADVQGGGGTAAIMTVGLFRPSATVDIATTEHIGVEEAPNP